MCLPEDIEFKAKTQRRRDAAQTEEGPRRSEEHTSELQSQSNLVCRLLLEKKKQYLELTWNHQRIWRMLKVRVQRCSFGFPRYNVEYAAATCDLRPDSNLQVI